MIRHKAFEDRKRREEAHLVGLRNEVRSFMGADPIDPYETSPSPTTDKNGTARKALLRRMDFDETEEVSPGDLQSLH